MIFKRGAILFFFLVSTVGLAQQEKTKSLLRDSIDGKLDVSNFLIEANGFIPVVQLITEPALGGIGGLLTPIFIHPNKYQEEGKYVAPNITAGFAGYTANDSWFFGGMRIASLPKYGLKYRIGGAYASVNLDFYRDIGSNKDVEFPFNFETFGFFGSLTKEIGNTNIYAGLEYLFLKNNISPEFAFTTLPDFVTEKEFKNVQSSPGFIIEYDVRDNIFTPNKGTLITTNFRVNADWTGSDFEYQNFSAWILQYFQTTAKLVSGFRLETQQQFGDAPFYVEPGISLRGVPAVRYQGTSTYLAETEQRYDFTMRWSGVAFTGMAKAIADKESFKSAKLIYNYGVGFRYLLARKFNLRVGIDVGWSNNDFGYYIVFGSAWNNRS
ncbi:BamA/TamA family outer membrane protein [Owenweeksia hongkongensis]|uniref:BamA/TamA family outer membrane protein n=1 Tax=Owenweeksia hongkongensis TaxID=253245 RepID=UPI003A950D8A